MRATLACICLTALAACSGLFGPEPSFSFAAATNGCGPADQPFPIIVLAPSPITSLANAPVPNVSVVIYTIVSPLSGHTWDVGGGVDAAATFSPVPGISQAASSGSITITNVDSSKTVEGTVDLQFPSRHIVTQFRAPAIPSGIPCN